MSCYQKTSGFFFVLCLAAACGASKEAAVAVRDNGEADSVRYELIISDPGFDRWFSIHQRPVGFHSESFYENKNQTYVIRWNQLVDQGAGGPFVQRINYDREVDYPESLDYKLYYYFKYVDERFGRRYNFSA